MSTPQISLLAGLVKGYTGEKQRLAEEHLKQQGAQRDLMVQYLGHLASNPNVPPEHQQWALGKVHELIEADPSKKLPKIDMGELPAVSVQPPPRSTTPQLPGMTLQPPVGPQGAQPSIGQSSAALGGSGDVGRASNGTVNAMGNAGAPMGPPVPPDLELPAAPNFSVAPPSPVTIPGHAQATVVNPSAPIPISQKGQLHLLTPQDKSAYAGVAQQEELQRLKQQFPGRSDEDLAHYAKAGEFPKDEYSLNPGEKRYKDGKEVAANATPKPGEKSGFAYERGPSGEVLIKNNQTGATLSEQEIKANPQAKAVYDTAQKAVETAEARQDARDEQKFTRAQELSDQHEEAGRRKVVYSQAVDGAKKAKPMVDVLDASEQYMKEGNFSPREDLALIVRAVRAMNPGSVRLPQKELELEIKAGSYGDRFSRWYTGATEGLLPPDQRQDLMNVIRKETTTTATSAAENWRDSFKGTKEEEPPTYLRRFEHKEGGAGGIGPGQFTVTDPKGGVHTFPDQASADRFKAAIGQ